MPRPNWFFAFPIDGTFVLDLPAPPTNIRRYHPDDVHLTLVFLGGCGEEAARRALRVLDERLASATYGTLEVALGEVVPMGKARAYSALSALLGKGRDETSAVTRALATTLKEAALGRPETRAPKPHVTLARPVRRATAAQRDAGLEWADTLELGGVTRRLDRIALYTWQEDRRERLFRIVEERPLC